jgi:hypothetical protein
MGLQQGLAVPAEAEGRIHGHRTAHAQRRSEEFEHSVEQHRNMSGWLRGCSHAAAPEVFG